MQAFACFKSQKSMDLQCAVRPECDTSCISHQCAILDISVTSFQFLMMGLAKKTIVFLKTPPFGVLHLFKFCLFLIEKIKASID